MSLKIGANHFKPIHALMATTKGYAITTIHLPDKLIIPIENIYYYFRNCESNVNHCI